jgi:hypothetical protein
MDDTSLTRQTLGRLESSISSLSDSFAVYRDDVATLKIQLANHQSQTAAMAADWKSSVQGISTTFQAEVDKIGADISRVSDRLNEKEKPRRDIWIGMISAGIAFMSIFTAAAAFFVNAEIGTAIAPIVQQQAAINLLIPQMHDLELASLRSTQADTRSEQDRGELNRRMTVMENSFATGLAERREQIAHLESGRVEIETQFKNLTGLVYYLWHKLMGDAFPIVPREQTK